MEGGGITVSRLGCGSDFGGVAARRRPATSDPLHTGDNGGGRRGGFWYNRSPRRRRADVRRGSRGQAEEPDLPVPFFPVPFAAPRGYNQRGPSPRFQHRGSAPEDDHVDPLASARTAAGPVAAVPPAPRGPAAGR